MSAQLRTRFRGGRTGAVLFCGLLAGCAGSGPGATDELPFDPAGPASAPDPMQPGPFAVGVKTFDLADPARPDPDTGQARRLLTEVWYPAVQSATAGPFWRYDAKAEVDPELLGDKYAAFMAADLPLISTATVRDAELDRAHGPYPIVLYSHGANGVRWQSIFYTAHLASHGYVVISPDHQHNTIWDLIRDGYDAGTVVTSSYKRIDDMSFLLDEFLGRDRDPTDFFYAALDRQRVAATGHSFGGFTSIALACKDPRIQSVVAHSPLISLTIGWCDLQDYPVALMVQGGTLDVTLPWRDQYCDYRALDGAQPRYLMELVDAGHYTFADICQLDLISLSEELDFGGAVEDALRDGCAPDNLPWQVAHPVINHYATALFNVHLRDSAGSLAFLTTQADPAFEPVNFFAGPAPDFPDPPCGE
jgi:predicted dienelactone hydrolase